MSFKSYSIDGLLNINALPPLPWTQEALGVDLYASLANSCGAGVSSTALNPSVDVRTFALSRAHKIVAEYGLTGEEAEAVFLEAQEIQGALDATLAAPTGTPREPGAPPLTGSTTTKRERKF